MTSPPKRKPINDRKSAFRNDTGSPKLIVTNVDGHDFDNMDFSEMCKIALEHEFSQRCWPQTSSKLSLNLMGQKRNLPNLN